MKRPLIAVTASYQEGRIHMRDDYLRAVWAAGGLPAYLPQTGGAETAETAAAFDGFLFAGGGDLDPALYGEKTLSDTVHVESGRDAFELSLFAAARARHAPIFGICRGVQLLNVALGGSLYQDVEGHRQSGGYRDHAQTVTVCGDFLRAIVGRERLAVNSFHHQAVKKPAPGLCVEAAAPDGTVEAVSLPGGPFLLGVQWHPECFFEDDPAAAALFSAFVAACAK